MLKVSLIRFIDLESYIAMAWRNRIIIFAIAILPILNIGGMQLFTQDWKEKDFDLHLGQRACKT